MLLASLFAERGHDMLFPIPLAIKLARQAATKTAERARTSAVLDDDLALVDIPEQLPVLSASSGY
eukprot:5646423-Pleurochrysis_carterae.AAC.1